MNLPTYNVGFWHYTRDDYDWEVYKTNAENEQQAIELVKARTEVQRLAVKKNHFEIMYSVVLMDTYKATKTGKVYDGNPIPKLYKPCISKAEAEIICNEWNTENKNAYPLQKKAYVVLY